MEQNILPENTAKEETKVVPEENKNNVVVEKNSPEDTYPVDVKIEYQEKYSRGLALMTLLFLIPKAIMLVPHFIILYFLGICAIVAWIFGQIAVLVTGKYPRSFFDFLVSVTRWKTRVGAYLMGLTDKYPPFRMK